jgi:hypothetical protein
VGEYSERQNMTLIPKHERDNMPIPKYSMGKISFLVHKDFANSVISRLLDHADAMDTLLAQRDAEIKRLTEQNHCCRQFSDLSGLTVEEVERVGSCGCMQAKRLLERMAKAL